MSEVGIIAEDIDIPIPSSQGVDMVYVIGGQVKSFRFDLWQTIEDILDDELLAESCHWWYEQGEDRSGQRSIGEMWTGQWWCEQEQHAHDLPVLCIILYTDETTLSLNGRSMHPVYITLGNIPQKLR